MTAGLSTRRMVLDAPAKLLTINAAKSMHYRSWAIVTKAWREAAAERAKDLILPPFLWVEVDCWIYQARGVLADPGAHTPVCKAVIDGLRDAQVLADDTGHQVKWIRMHPPKRGPAGVVLELNGPLLAARPATPHQDAP